jgi:hypothetical protein
MQRTVRQFTAMTALWGIWFEEAEPEALVVVLMITFSRKPDAMRLHRPSNE